MFILLTFECYVMIVFPSPFRPVSDGSANISFHICHLTLSHNARQHIKEMEIIHPQKHYDDKINILLCFLILWIGTNLKFFPSMISTMDDLCQQVRDPLEGHNLVIKRRGKKIQKEMRLLYNRVRVCISHPLSNLLLMYKVTCVNLLVLSLRSWYLIHV